MNGVEAKHIVVLNVQKLVLQRRYCFGGDVEDCLLYFARWPQQLE